MSSSSDFEAALSQYLAELESASNERQRAQYFIEFLRRDLDLSKEFVGYPTRLRPELEEPLGGVEQQSREDYSLDDFSGDGDDEASLLQEATTEEEKQTVFISGRLDARVGNLIMEFKDDLTADIGDAKDQLRKYVYLLHQRGVEEDLVCFATDGRVFRPYEALVSDTVESRDDVTLSTLQAEIDLEQSSPDAVRRWFRSFIEERVHPTVERIDQWFGVESDMFEQCYPLIEDAYEGSEIAEVHFDEWRKYLLHAQGATLDEVDSKTLFLRHTYLASFAKLFTYMVLIRSSVPSPDYGTELLHGDVDEPFPDNIFVQDLFSWLGTSERGEDISEKLIDALLNFDLGNISQDVFKRLYQKMVSPDVRHDLGEYYTPDWLATYITQEISVESDDRVLDPSCGSGTFLVETIAEKEPNQSDQPTEFLASLQNDVVGIDVHPLAVAVAKANYIAAIEHLLRYRRGRFSIPIYLADSVYLELLDEDELISEELEGITVTDSIRIGDEEYRLPLEALDKPSKLDAALDLVNEYLHDERGFERHITQISGLENVVPIFEQIRERMAAADEAGQDSIHAYILKNFYRPLYLLGDDFDVILGNPPWLVYNNMNSQQQQNMRELTRLYGLYPTAENVTHMELATLFFVRSIDLYLDDDGEIGFVMPRSIFRDGQHDPFRRGNANTSFALTRILDLEGIEPLFNVPEAAIFAAKGEEFGYPVLEETLVGDLERKNARLKNVEEGIIQTNEGDITIEEGEIFLSGNGISSWEDIPALTDSEYLPDFEDGATLYPRSFVLVELDEQARERFGFDPARPPVWTALRPRENSEEPYDVVLEGSVESDFLYSTLLGGDVVPFAHCPFRPAVLPVVSESSGYNVIEADQARDGGYSGLAEWLDESNDHWNGGDNRETVSEQYNFRHKITRQNPNASFRVVYLKDSTNIAACVVVTEQATENTELDLQGLIIDHELRYYETENVDEAYYLSAILNSNVINEGIKPLQSKGNYGPRHIHKLPLRFPIPTYDSNNSDHERLVELARQGEEKASEHLPDLIQQYEPDLKPTNSRWLRERTRENVHEEVEAIDRIVERLLQIQSDMDPASESDF